MENFEPPLVSCIMPTYNRRKFVPFAVRYFLRQQYPNKELVVVDDGTDPIEDLIPDGDHIRYIRLEKKISLGEKLNIACDNARGEIIAHWDDDDWYDPQRLGYQIDVIQKGGADVCGINQLLYLNITTKHAYQYKYPSNQRTWLLGSSLVYTKSLWHSNPFAPVNVGMDALFVWSTAPARVKPMPDPIISVHMIHEDNASPKKTSGSWWYDYPVAQIQKLMGEDWNTYSNGTFSRAKVELKNPVPVKSAIPETRSPFKNIYACLVHENEDCIIDLVRNLHHHDPGSSILLFNGSGDSQLMNGSFPYQNFGATIHPEPVPVEHGYLHPFALRCLEFALDKYLFDTLTIVDSDQLALKPDYSAFIAGYLRNKTNVGLLSSKPEKISPGNTEIWPAIQAFKEYELWKPLLKQFPNGEEKFVHWTFWPSSVFTRDAAKELTRLFRENRLLQEIMRQTKIWATEEIVLPTLVSLLGYDIVQNPCAADFVRYKKTFTPHDVKASQSVSNAYWMHPVDRKYDDGTRSFAREKSGHYKSQSASYHPSPAAGLFVMSSLLSGIKGIEGWLTDAEAELLASIALTAGNKLPAPQRIVEIGSFQGKSTVVLGSVVQAFFPAARVFAIDPHEGRVGALDQGIQQVPPTLENFKRNIARAGLDEVVELIKDYSFCVPWEAPIALLFIDGLHDYPNVARDFWKFSPFVVPGGYIAFHDYADYYPGVQALVDEVLAGGGYSYVQLADSLIVIQKV